MTKNLFELRFGMNAGADQASLLGLLKSKGCEAIQTSGGLCVKTDGTKEDLDQWLGEAGASGVTVAAVRTQGDHPPNVRAFIANRS